MGRADRGAVRIRMGAISRAATGAVAKRIAGDGPAVGYSSHSMAVSAPKNQVFLPSRFTRTIAVAPQNGTLAGGLTRVHSDTALANRKTPPPVATQTASASTCITVAAGAGRVGRSPGTIPARTAGPAGKGAPAPARGEAPPLCAPAGSLAAAAGASRSKRPVRRS